MFVLILLKRFLFDAGCFSAQLTEIVELGSPDLSFAVNRNTIDEGRVDGEDTLNADVIRHFANREPLVIALTRNADNYSAVLLDTLLVTFHNTVSNRYGVAALELGPFFLSRGERLFCNFN
mgnify:CR=1 FL=1